MAAQTTLATCRAGISCAIALSTGSRKELDSQAVGLPALRLVISRLQANTAHFRYKDVWSVTSQDGQLLCAGFEFAVPYNANVKSEQDRIKRTRVLTGRQSVQTSLLAALNLPCGHCKHLNAPVGKLE